MQYLGVPESDQGADIIDILVCIMSNTIYTFWTVGRRRHPAHLMLNGSASRAHRDLAMRDALRPKPALYTSIRIRLSFGYASRGRGPTIGDVREIAIRNATEGPMRSLAKEARAARHASVLDEATAECNREGVSGASLSEIARRVCSTRAGLYNYCLDRQDLVHQCYLRTCKSFKSDLLRAEQTPGNSLDRVAAFVRIVLDAEHPPAAGLTELGFLNPEQEASVRAARGETVAAMRALLAQGVKEGSIRSCDLDIVSQALFGMLTWTTLSRVWTADTDDTLGTRMAAMAPQIILEGVAADGVDIPPSRARLAGILPAPPNSERDERLAAPLPAGP